MKMALETSAGNFGWVSLMKYIISEFFKRLSSMYRLQTFL